MELKNGEVLLLFFGDYSIRGHNILLCQLLHDNYESEHLVIDCDFTEAVVNLSIIWHWSLFSEVMERFLCVFFSLRIFGDYSIRGHNILLCQLLHDNCEFEHLIIDCDFTEAVVNLSIIWRWSLFSEVYK